MPLEVLAIYTEYEQNPDLAHRSYAREANDWLGAAALASGYSYEATTDWQRLEAVVPARGRILMFLDDKPAVPAQRASFESYMNSGGAWIGCHYAAYNSSPSDWDWYFNQFLGAGAHAGNTWRPTSAQLRVEDPSHPLAQGLEAVITAAPNEWYAWTTDLTTQSAIKILLSIDPSSFPLGTGPKPEEIWHSGYYPVVWTNTTYKMVYINMGHDDIDYEGGTLQSLSSTFSSSAQNRMLLNAIQWLSAAQ